MGFTSMWIPEHPERRLGLVSFFFEIRKNRFKKLFTALPVDGQLVVNPVLFFTRAPTPDPTHPKPITNIVQMVGVTTGHRHSQ